jgi:hypothetical protein
MSGGSDLDLWNRIQAYSPDRSGVSLPFSARLARENGWSPEFSRRVVEEYKKFIYLICVSNEMLTPSEEVDQAWHLHLVYTRDYWIGFCRDVLGRDIHHHPTEGGPSEGAGYRDCYRRTRDRYREEFGVPPPADIWPGEEIRFGKEGRFRLVDTTTSLVVKRSHVGIGAAALGLALLTGCTLSGNSIAAVAVFVFFAGLVLSVVLAPNRRNRRRDEGGGGGACRLRQRDRGFRWRWRRMWRRRRRRRRLACRESLTL